MLGTYCETFCVASEVFIHLYVPRFLQHGTIQSIRGITTIHETGSLCPEFTDRIINEQAEIPDSKNGYTKAVA